MWSEIIDPITGDKVSLNSRQGIQILRNYLLTIKKFSMRGGAAAAAEEEDAVPVAHRTSHQDSIRIYASKKIMRVIARGVEKENVNFKKHVRLPPYEDDPSAQAMANMAQEDWAGVVPQLISEGFAGRSFFAAATDMTRGAVVVATISEYIRDANLLLVIRSGSNIVGFAVCNVNVEKKVIKLHVIGTKERAVSGSTPLGAKHLINTLKNIAAVFSESSGGASWWITLDSIIEVFGYYLKLGFYPEGPSGTGRTSEVNTRDLPKFAKKLRELNEVNADNQTMIQYFHSNRHISFIPLRDRGFAKWVKEKKYYGIPMYMLLKFIRGREPPELSYDVMDDAEWREVATGVAPEEGGGGGDAEPRHIGAAFAPESGGGGGGGGVQRKRKRKPQT